MSADPVPAEELAGLGAQRGADPAPARARGPRRHAEVRLRRRPSGAGAGQRPGDRCAGRPRRRSPGASSGRSSAPSSSATSCPIGSVGDPRRCSSREPDDRERIDADPVRCADAGPASRRWSTRSTRPARTATRSAGVVEVVVHGLPPGLGSHVHWDRRLDARLAAALMGIQAIKGVEVGDGFAMAARRGSDSPRRDRARRDGVVRRPPAARAAPRAACRRARCCGSARP